MTDQHTPWCPTAVTPDVVKTLGKCVWDSRSADLDAEEFGLLMDSCDIVNDFLFRMEAL